MWRGHDLQRKRGGVLRKETMHQGREGWVGQWGVRQERGQAIKGRGMKETCCHIAIVVVAVVVVTVVIIAIVVVAVVIVAVVIVAVVIVAVVIVVVIVSHYCCCHCYYYHCVHLVFWCTQGCWTKGECRWAI